MLVEFVLVNDLLGVLDEDYKMFLNGQKSTFLVFYSSNYEAKATAYCSMK